MTDRLLPLVERVRNYKMSPDEVSEQRVSFAYGNASQKDNSTKEQVREAVTSATSPDR